jgi:hypothetical protein
MLRLTTVLLGAAGLATARDCVVTDWGYCGPCTKPCGGGVQECARRVTVQPTADGKACPTELFRTQACNADVCEPEDCQLGEWDCSAGACSRTCGSGTHQCVRPVLREAQAGGKACPPEKTRTKSIACNTAPCPIDCVVSTWGAVGACSKTCGGGFVTHKRQVLTAAENGGKPCPALVDTLECNAEPCPADCALSSLDQTTCGTCSKTCGGGIQSCLRTILRQPMAGGAPCKSLTGYQPCNLQKPCVEDCKATDFGPWGACSATCGEGHAFRRRTILQQPSFGGEKCPPMIELKACLVVACPIDCQVSPFGYYGPCDKTCGEGSRTRERTVVLQPLLDGKPCPHLKEHQKCNNGACPLDCIVSEWGKYSLCTHTCGPVGLQARRRTIVRAALDGGAPCPVLAQEAPCNTHIECPVDCTLHQWSVWLPCTKTCGGGISTRMRAVKTAQAGTGKPCDAEHEANQCGTAPCPIDCVVTEFDTCSTCTATCGGGTQFCMRSITTPASFGGTPCPAVSKTRKCNTDPCPVDCVPSGFNDWSACSVTCGTGQKVRARTAMVEVAHGGVPCPALTETKECTGAMQLHCPVDCALTPWHPWSECTRSCGTGLQTATRDITQQPSNGGEICGDVYQFRKCHTTPCPVDCKMSPFGEWSTCSATCAGGKTVRKRTALVNTQFFGRSCPHTTEERDCNVHSCELPQCHDKHVTCHMVGIGRHAQVVVNHQMKFMNIEGDFTCARTNSDGQLPRMFEACKCKCTKHPGCCAKKNYVLKNDVLVGSIFKGVESKDACCNKCTAHPSCDAWEWSPKQVCVLKKGQPVYEAQEAFDTWAGPRAGDTCEGAGVVEMTAPFQFPQTSV